MEELDDLAKAGLGAVDRDAEIARLGQAELAEAGGVAAAAEDAVERADAFASPGDAVDQIGIADQQAFDLAVEEGAVVGIVEAGIGGGPAVRGRLSPSAA